MVGLCRNSELPTQRLIGGVAWWFVGVDGSRGGTGVRWSLDHMVYRRVAIGEAAVPQVYLGRGALVNTAAWELPGEGKGRLSDNLGEDSR